ncbi:hypothetical protein POV27_12645 [Aureisphaera galaxeae]|uniref:hypothetical protein n=1 Tax=Aureisphaera galaxeae TaxID=1538023 RepID=UPI0023506DA4|nr:hypothetical protein [Aureisphaera galaxeae]MDC8004903.1 hypothetical protein [Aureisphaera galaxeae]
MIDMISDIFRGMHMISYLQIITALIGVLNYRKFKDSPVKYFIWAFVYFACNEFFATFYGRVLAEGYNAIVYNIYYFVSFSILGYLFYTSIKNRRFKLFLKLMYAVYIALILIDVFVLKTDYHTKYQVWPYIIAGITILVCILFFFYEALNSESVVKLDRNLMFWIGIGYFFYYLAMVPFKVSKNFYAINREFYYLFKLPIIMTTVLNISLIIGFLWSRTQQQNS